MTHANVEIGSAGGRRLANTGLYAIYAVAVLFTLFPILAVVMLSMKQPSEVFSWPPTFLPATLNLDTYIYVLTETTIGRMLWNSVFLTACSTAGCIAISAPAAYAFSRLKFRAQKPLLLILLVYQMISSMVIALPLYRYFEALGLLDSHMGVILVYITVEIPFTVWLLKGFFDAIPPSLDEAARIDGASRLQVLRIVILPLAKPGLAAALIFNVIAGWSQFIIPFILIQRAEMLPISIGVLNFAPGQTEGEITIPYLAAASIIAMLPALTMFVLLQRYIVQALTGGAVKG
ncbi:carbohydrate ABC transporter permease [Shinella granuli]|jgi:multiple sugar transport system permease protein|uniref:Maltose/maltodextrin transport system permease protein MalG n=1 Tax=Shinella granuli TaxID=323621 RepID=A0A4R2BX27_SHIGR|nr:carbohydrate ABC transporter permease [Shinella granuli]TCN30699.1 carbohydrate ABC transporter membrane protein 2 (CUT1 family) [Shinella granuli]